MYIYLYVNVISVVLFYMAKMCGFVAISFING